MERERGERLLNILSCHGLLQYLVPPVAKPIDFLGLSLHPVWLALLVPMSEDNG